MRVDLAFAARHGLDNVAPEPVARAVSDAPRSSLRGVIQPWGIRVRAHSTSGKERPRWRAVSGSLFTAYEAGDANVPARVHHGLIERLMRVEHIAEIDERSSQSPNGCSVVRFDAVAWLSTGAGSSWVSEGGVAAEGRAAIACDGVHGLLVIDRPGSSDADWVTCLERRPALGHVAALIDVGGTGFWMRATHLRATHLSGPEGLGHLVLELAGSPVLPTAGRWMVTRRAANERAPQALPPGQPMPVIQPRGDATWHVADAADLFNVLRPAASAPPRTEYGLLHDTGTQRLYFPQPRIGRIAVTSSGECGRLRLPPDQCVQFADWCALLNADTEFPVPEAAFGLRLTETEMPTFGIDGWHFHVRRPWPDTRSATLVDTGAAQLQLRRGDAARPDAAWLDIAFSDTQWSVSPGPLCIDLQSHGERLLSFAFDAEHADSRRAPQLLRPRLIPAAVLAPLGDWLPGLWNLRARTSGDSGLPAAVPLRLAGGQLHIGCAAQLDDVAWGFGHLKHAPLTLGGTARARPAGVEFGLSLGSVCAPMTLIAGSHTGAAMVRIGVVSGGPQIDVRVALALPMQLAPDAPDSGSAALDVNLRTDGSHPVRVGGVASGHAVVDVLGGLACASLAVESPCRVWPDRPTPGHVRLEADLIAGVHLPLCSLLDTDAHADVALGIDIERGS